MRSRSLRAAPKISQLARRCSGTRKTARLTHRRPGSIAPGATEVTSLHFQSASRPDINSVVVVPPACAIMHYRVHPIPRRRVTTRLVIAGPARARREGSSERDGQTFLGSIVALWLL